MDSSISHRLRHSTRNRRVDPRPINPPRSSQFTVTDHVFERPRIHHVYPDRIEYRSGLRFSLRSLVAQCHGSSGVAQSSADVGYLSLSHSSRHGSELNSSETALHFDCDVPVASIEGDSQAMTRSPSVRLETEFCDFSEHYSRSSDAPGSEVPSSTPLEAIIISDDDDDDDDDDEISSVDTADDTDQESPGRCPISSESLSRQGTSHLQVQRRTDLAVTAPKPKRSVRSRSPYI